jgi:hypothetical protein
MRCRSNRRSVLSSRWEVRFRRNPSPAQPVAVTVNVDVERRAGAGRALLRQRARLTIFDATADTGAAGAAGSRDAANAAGCMDAAASSADAAPIGARILGAAIMHVVASIRMIAGIHVLGARRTGERADDQREHPKDGNESVWIHGHGYRSEPYLVVCILSNEHLRTRMPRCAESDWCPVVSGSQARYNSASMVTLRNALTRGLGLGLVAGVVLFGCQGPDEFFRGDDGGFSGFGGSPTGSGGDTGTGGFTSTGGITGTGGLLATGGFTGTGGKATGGFTGTGGTATGGIKGTGGTATGGIKGTGGTATGGIKGTGGMATGGFTGTGGRATGGAGGRATGGTTGTGGTSGTAGSTGTGPCAGLCTSPTTFTTQSYSSGNVGTGAACFETTVSIQGGNCSNVPAPRTFSVNGKVETCGQNWPSLPAKIDGGYCFQFTAGSPDYSAFTTF